MLKPSLSRGLAPLAIVTCSLLAGVPLASATQPAPISWDFDGDGHPDLISGKPRYDFAVPLAGDVEVYSTHNQAQIGQVTSPDADDFFGTSVASVGDIDGDGKADFAVGALASNLNTTDQLDSGRVIVYSGADQSVIHDISVIDVKFLGRTVAGVGDVDGDGVPDIAAAGYGQTPMGGYQETVFIFSGVDGALVREIESWLGADMLGYAMTGLGDINADGIGDFAMSAPYALPDAGALIQGKVYVFLGEARGPTATHGYTTDAFNEIVNLDADLSIGTFLLHGTDQNADDIAELLVVSRYLGGPHQYLYLAESIDVSTGQRVVIGEPDPLGGHGDVDRDLDIDGDDLNALIVLYGLPSDPDDPFNGDFNGDGVVDAQDLNDVVAQYGHEHPLADLALAEGELILMTREIALSFAIQAGSNCGRPVRAIGFPGATVMCDTGGSGWPGPGPYESQGGQPCLPTGTCCPAGQCYDCVPNPHTCTGNPGDLGGSGSGGGGPIGDPSIPPGGWGGDSDGDGIIDRADCTYGGSAATCCELVPDPNDPWGQTSIFKQNADDDGDCIINALDCDCDGVGACDCYVGNATLDCECQVDENGIRNQDKCDNPCEPTESQSCIEPQLLVDSNNDGAIIAEDDDSIEADTDKPGRIVVRDDDDDDANDILDRVDAALDPTVNNDTQLVLVDPVATSGTWKISYTDDLIALWGNDGLQWVLIDDGEEGDLPFPYGSSVRVQGIGRSEELADARLTLIVVPDDPGEQCPAGAVTDTVRFTVVAVDLVGDANRDGSVTPDDDFDPGGDDFGEEEWDYGLSAAPDHKKGMIVLVNNDDDEKVQGVVGSPDGSDAIINGPYDADDLALLIIRPLGPLQDPQGPGHLLPQDWRLTLTVSQSGDKVRVFDGLDPATAVMAIDPGSPPHEYDVPLVDVVGHPPDLEYGMEALEYPGWPDATFDGLVTLTLALVDDFGVTVFEDVVEARVAPWLMPSHADLVTQVFVTDAVGPRAATPTVAAAGSFKDRLNAQLQGTGFTATVLPVGQWHPLNHPNADLWPQDQYEFGFQSAPGGVWNTVLLNSPRKGYGPPFLSELAATEVLDIDIGIYGVTLNGSNWPDPPGPDSQDSFGNLECFPRFGDDVIGRAYHGPGGMQVALAGFLASQPPVHAAPIGINTDWLSVGHVDEIMSVYATGSSITVFLASTAMATAILEQSPGSVFENGQLWADDTPPYTAPQLLVDANGTDIRAFNQTIQVELDLIYAQLLQLGVTNIVEIPVYFVSVDASGVPLAGGLARAALPDMVNMLNVNNTLVVPDPQPHLTTANDPFKQAFITQTGITPQWIDCLEYHWSEGEVHCGTNTKRIPPVQLQEWWKSTP